MFVNIPETTPSWDLTRDLSSMHRRYYELPPANEPQEWVGRTVTEEKLIDTVWQNLEHRASTDHANFTFLVASGHVRSGKTRAGYETPRIVKKVCEMNKHLAFCDPVYLRIDLFGEAKFNSQFDLASLSTSEALGARLMHAFYKNEHNNLLKRLPHGRALQHIINTVQLQNPNAIVPIVIHFDEHGHFINDRDKTLKNDEGKKYFVDMLREIGSFATSEHATHQKGKYFIVPITTGTSQTDANIGAVSSYQIAKVPLPVLALEDMIKLARACLSLKFDDRKIVDDIMSQLLFQIALGDTGGLPGLIVMACDKSQDKISYVQHLHNRVSQYIRIGWNSRWRATTSVFLARPRVTDSTLLAKGYSVRQALDSGTVFYRSEGELGLAPALLAQFNLEQNLFDPILVRSLSTSEDWTWQDFEKAHLLFLAATLNALIEECERFPTMTLGTFLCNVQPSNSAPLQHSLNLPNKFQHASLIVEPKQCIPKSTAGAINRLSVDLSDVENIHQTKSGTPIVDGYLNLKLNNLEGTTTLFIQYKHSALSSTTSTVNVSTMNKEYAKLKSRLKKHGWPNDRPFLFLWVTNRTVDRDEEANNSLLWICKESLADHAPLLGQRGLVPTEKLRESEYEDDS